VDWTISCVDSGFLVQIQDITERKKTEESLKKSEEKYRSLFDDDLTGDFIATPEGEIIECNPAFVEIYGFYSQDNALQSHISKFNSSDWINLIQRLKNEGRIKGYQSWQRRNDGQEIHVIANVVGIFDDSGELIQVKGYIFDDTERKKTEDSLKESEEKYHRLFDEDLTGDFIASLNGEILECNPAFAEIYGFSNCKMTSNLNISQFNSFDWPYLITRLKKEGKIKGYQSWQRRSDGRRIHVIANVVGIFNDSKELIQIKGYVFDDTERKNAEEELILSKNQMKDILDSIQDGFAAINHYWKFVYVNRHAGDYFGVGHEELIGQNIWDNFPDLLGTDYEKAFRKAIQSKEIQHFESPGILMEDHWFEFSVYPSDEGISVYWRDITKRKNMEEKLK
jgi:PAS domain S-box-containing protein